MEYRRSIKGFTLLEIVIVVSIIALITTFATLTFTSMYRSSGERIAREEVMAAFRDSRSKTLGSVSDTVYGVRVGTSSVTRFVGTAYVPGASTNEVYQFEAGTTATGTLVMESIDVVFSRLTGVPSATGTVYLRDIDNTSTTTVTIHGTGLVE